MKRTSELFLCPYPFSRTSLSRKDFVPCCSDWLHLKKNDSPNLESPWNSEAAIAMREAHLKGDFSMCRRELCQEPLIDFHDLEGPLYGASYYLSESHIQEARNLQSRLKSGPGMISFGGSDNRCNLKCPSCRDHLITKLTKRKTNNFFEQVALLKEYKNDIHILRFGDNGEVFFSPWLRRVLKISSPKIFPQLKETCLLSNGTLLTKTMWENLRPGTDWVREINISIDAGNEETYKKVRGNLWKQLMQNLEFVSTLRREGKIERFFLNFTVQKNNFESLSDLLNLATGLQVDAVILHPMAQWGHLSSNQYLAHAVHRNEHPLFEEYQNILNELLKRKYSFEIRFKMPPLLS